MLFKCSAKYQFVGIITPFSYAHGGRAGMCGEWMHVHSFVVPAIESFPHNSSPPPFMLFLSLRSIIHMPICAVAVVVFLGSDFQRGIRFLIMLGINVE